ncbi:hypothetical protein B0H13DRAFT_2366147 [Mycena leptocephala]|nr:hypothetical protein B0H13DRAFT_2366147 [Mycena leptocephala]
MELVGLPLSLMRRWSSFTHPWKDNFCDVSQVGISLLSASYAAIIRRPHPLCLLPPAFPIPLRIRAHFDCLMVLTTLSRSALAPAFVDLSHCRSRRESCAEWPLQSSPAIHNPALPCGLRTSLIPACEQPDGAAYMPFWVLRALWIRVGGRFFGLAPLLFACAGVGLLRNECKSFSSCASGSAASPVHACEAAAATSPHLRISHTNLMHLVCLLPERSAQPGMGMQMDMEWALRFDTLSFCSPTFAFALVPTFAHTLAPTLLLAMSCAGPRTHSHTRGDGEVRVRVRVQARCEDLLSLIVVLVIPSSCAAGAAHVRYARDIDIEAGVYACAYGTYLAHVLALALVMERSAVGIVVLLLRGYGRRTLRRLWYTFGFG